MVRTPALELVLADPTGPRTLWVCVKSAHMTRYAGREHINCHPDEVWAVLCAVERWPEWCPTVRSAVLRGATMAKGTLVHIEQPWLRPAVWRVCEWEPPIAFSWETAHPGVRVVGRHHIEARTNGCLVELALEFSGPLAVLTKALLAALARRYLRQELNALKAECQMRAKARSP